MLPIAQKTYSDYIALFCCWCSFALWMMDPTMGVFTMRNVTFQFNPTYLLVAGRERDKGTDRSQLVIICWQTLFLGTSAEVEPWLKTRNITETVSIAHCYNSTIQKQQHSVLIIVFVVISNNSRYSPKRRKSVPLVLISIILNSVIVIVISAKKSSQLIISFSLSELIVAAATGSQQGDGSGSKLK